MEQESLLRWAVLVGVAALLPIGIYHRAKSQSTGEPLDRRQEGLFILATLRPLGAACWLGLLAWLIEPRWMAWSSVPLPIALRWTGISLLAAAAALVFWTFRSLGANLTDTVVTRREHTLVVHGPYRWVRHPFYDAAALLVLGTSLVAANWFLLASGMLAVSLLIARTRIEERNLVGRFGVGYQTYMAQTGRFWPRYAPRRARPERSAR